MSRYYTGVPPRQYPQLLLTRRPGFVQIEIRFKQRKRAGP